MLVLLIMLGMVLLVACAAMWPDNEEQRAQEPAVAPAGPLDVATSLEGALTGQLLAGEISATQYRYALARLAARDDERHPLSVPPGD